MMDKKYLKIKIGKFFLVANYAQKCKIIHMIGVRNIFAVILCLFTRHAYAHTTIIHAVGINPKNLEENHESFYSEAEQFLSYCKSAGLKLGSDCKLFIDLDTKREGGVGANINKSKTMGDSTPKKILKAFEDALKSGKPGDQVVLSLNNHGGPSLIHSSCIFTGPGAFDEICKDDVESILKKYKKPGIKVFINADACMSGSFSELTTKDVCTLVASDRFRSAGASNFWKATMETRSEKKPLSLSEIKPNILFAYDADASGGGFGSQIIKTRLCELNAQDFPLQERNKLADTVNTTLSNLHFKMNKIKNYSCNQTTPDANIGSIYNFAGNVAVALNKDQNPLNTAIRDYCTLPHSSSKQLCTDLNAYKNEFEASTDTLIESLRQELEHKNNQLYSIDDQLRTETNKTENKQQLIKLEAKRGEILKDLIESKSKLENTINQYLHQQHHQKLVQILSRIHDELCFDFRKTNVDRDEKLTSHLSLSALRGDHVPNTNQAYKDALACESSFQLP